MTVGPGRACGVDGAGGLACWGQDANGFARAPLLGVGDGARDQCTAYDKTFRCSRTPLRVPVPAAVKEVAVANMHSCALTVDGRVYCWGDNSDGMLGAPQRGLRASATPRLVATPVRFTTIAGWYDTTCGTTASGVAYCWGLNDHAQGGARAESCGIYRCIQSPAPVGGAVRFTRLSVGEYRACGVSTDGGAYCWGMAGPASLGSLGAAVAREESASPVRVSLPEPVSGVSVGSYHACAVGRSGHAWCWGEGSFGDLGNGATSGSVTPVAVAGGHRFTLVSAGARTSCGLDTDGFLWCWGRNNWGQLGTGRPDMEGHAEPVRVPGDRRWRSVSVHEAVCAVDVEGKAWCWGANGWGEAGSGPLGSEPLCLSSVVRAACSSRPLPVLSPIAAPRAPSTGG
jgi:alpha-tubulin suppressor-like RCC1 family protein